MVAVGRSILVIVWHLPADPDAHFHDLGPDLYDTRIAPDRKKRNHIRQLEALGYTVTLTPARHITTTPAPLRSAGCCRVPGH